MMILMELRHLQMSFWPLVRSFFSAKKLKYIKEKEHWWSSSYCYLSVSLLTWMNGFNPIKNN